MKRFFPLLGAIALIGSGCSQVSYLEGYTPKTLVLRKDISGGFLELTGKELNVPGFSLYADGTVIYYGYTGGKRVLYFGRLDRAAFKSAMEKVERLSLCALSAMLGDKPVPGLDTLQGVPETHLFLDNAVSSCSLSVKGLGMFGDAHPAELLSFSAFCDTLRPKNAKPYRPNRLRLFVKKMSESESVSIRPWPVAHVPLDTIYRVPVSSYLLNDDRNSILVSGSDANRVMKALEVPSIYERFSFKDGSYRVGYRPLLPEESE